MTTSSAQKLLKTGKQNENAVNVRQINKREQIISKKNLANVYKVKPTR